MDNRKTNTSNSNIDYVYKYIKLKYLLAMLGSRQIRFERVMTWDDPYENFPLKYKYYKPDGRIYTDCLQQCYYGQSWTNEEESYAMWQIFSQYSQDKPSDISNVAVKIKVSIKKILSLMESGEELDGEKRRFNIVPSHKKHGSVEYCTLLRMENYFRSKYDEDSSNLLNLILECLFFKRKEYAYENEYRFLFYLTTDECLTDEDKRNRRCPTIPNAIVFNIPDVNDFIEEIVLDPRIDCPLICNGIALLLSLCGINRNKIHKSDIFEIPRANFKVE